MNNNNSKFIVTISEETAALLIKAKFNLIKMDNKSWTFLNEPGKLVFEKLDNVIYTNKLFI